MEKSTKTDLISASAVVVAAIIAGFFGLFSRKDPVPLPTKSVKIDSGSSGIVAGGNIEQNGKQDVIAGRDAYIYYGDKGKSKKGRAGDTYNVESDHQSGGVTAGKMELFNVSLIVPENKNAAPALPDNYIISVDTANHIIQVQPKSGVWLNTFLGIPQNELSSVQPHFQNSRTIHGMKIDSVKILDDNIFYMSTSVDPAAKDLSYIIHYKSFPSYLIFGNYPGPLYKAIIR